ncbi:MAG: hypothetical protein ABI867_24695, partial [Kofleriaceae bacterium]
MLLNLATALVERGELARARRGVGSARLFVGLRVRRGQERSLRRNRDPILMLTSDRWCFDRRRECAQQASERGRG